MVSSMHWPRDVSRTQQLIQIPRSCLLEAGIFLSHITWLLRTRKLRKEAADEGKTFDDIAAEHKTRGVPFKFAERTSCRNSKRQEKNAEEGVAGPEPVDVPVEEPGLREDAGAEESVQTREKESS